VKTPLILGDLTFGENTFLVHICIVNLNKHFGKQSQIDS
jgi:hypothetical protein